jgi:hypothetical protein
MEEPGFEESREALIQKITDIYSRGGMDMDAFERAVTRIHASGDRNSLATEAATLGLELPRAELELRGRPAMLRAASEPLELSCVSGNIRKVGDWVKARRYTLALKSSSARLDLCQYDGESGFRLFLDIDAVSSNLRLVVPEGFEVEDRLGDNVSSTVRNKPKGESYGDNIVVLSGSIRSSVVKIKYRR